MGLANIPTPIETNYNGYRFRSRLEARWAVFLDSLGIEYEYEPQGYRLPDGEQYLPDFKVRCYGVRGDNSYDRYPVCLSCEHCTEPVWGGDMADWFSNPFCVYARETSYGNLPTFLKARYDLGGGQDKTEIVECNRYDDRAFDLYIEVKGMMTQSDAKKIKSFSFGTLLDNDTSNPYLPEIKNKILVVGKIPPRGGSCNSSATHSYDEMNGCDIYPFNYWLIDGDFFAAYPAAHKGKFYLMGDDGNYINSEDIDEIEHAYDLARQARFEHGETPQIRRV